MLRTPICDLLGIEVPIMQNPELVITSPPVPANLVDEQLGWIELSPDTAQPSRFRVGERRWKSTNPTLDEVLSVVDETKRVRRQTRDE